MKELRLSTISLMLAIILWGTLLGGIAYSHLVYFPVYLSALPDSAVVVNGPYGLHEETFWLLIHPLLILSLIVSLALNWKMRARRRLIGISMTLYALAIVRYTINSFSRSRAWAQKVFILAAVFAFDNLLCCAVMVSLSWLLRAFGPLWDGLISLSLWERVGVRV